MLDSGPQNVRPGLLINTARKYASDPVYIRIDGRTFQSDGPIGPCVNLETDRSFEFRTASRVQSGNGARNGHRVFAGFACARFGPSACVCPPTLARTREARMPITPYLGSWSAPRSNHHLAVPRCKRTRLFWWDILQSLVDWPASSRATPRCYIRLISVACKH